MVYPGNYSNTGKHQQQNHQQFQQPPFQNQYQQPSFHQPQYQQPQYPQPPYQQPQYQQPQYQQPQYQQSLHQPPQYQYQPPQYQQPQSNQQYQQPQRYEESRFNSVNPPPYTPQQLPPHFGGSRAPTKKALFIGINYFRQRSELRGCINDVKNIKEFLVRKAGFKDDKDHIVALTDDQTHNPAFMPTRRNMTNAMQWLVNGAVPGDILFFHFSGHGGQVADKDGDEDDGYDETILPVDFQQAGQITDDEMHNIMCRNLPAGVRFVAVFDSCHSGTALDLPYVYLPDGTLKQGNQVGGILKETGNNFMRGGIVEGLMGLASGAQLLMKSPASKANTVAQKTTRADCIMLSGCKDYQTSADASIGGNATGAMSHALVKVLNDHPNSLTYGALLYACRNVLKAGYSQIPQFSSGKPINMNEVFYL